MGSNYEIYDRDAIASSDGEGKDKHFTRLPTPIRPRYSTPIILIPGGGVYYFWKAGFTMYLSKHFDLSRCIFMGTSAGALAALVTILADNIAKASR